MTSWVYGHPYISSLVGAITLIVIGAAVVVVRTPVAAQAPSIIAWQGSAPTNSSYYSQTGQQSPQQIAQEVIQNAPTPTFTEPAASSASAPAPSTQTGGDDYVALLEHLAASSSGTGPVQSTAGADTLAQAYTYIPQGFIATTTPAQKPLSPSQQAVYQYGNDVGSMVQSFEQENPNQPEILKDQAEDRTDSSKNTALITLGQHYVALGQQMEAMDNVPTIVQKLHDNLALSYEAMGQKLQQVPAAQSDSDFIKAIEAYDSTVDSYSMNYGALAQFFLIAGVSFSPGDPGSEFAFQSSGGL